MCRCLIIGICHSHNHMQRLEWERQAFCSYFFSSLTMTTFNCNGVLATCLIIVTILRLYECRNNAQREQIRMRNRKYSMLVTQSHDRTRTHSTVYATHTHSPNRFAVCQLQPSLHRNSAYMRKNTHVNGNERFFSFHKHENKSTSTCKTPND